MKKRLLIVCLFLSLASFSQKDFAYVLCQPQSSVNLRSLVKWDLSTNTYQQIISGIPLLPTQLLVDTPYIYVVGENFLLYQYNMTTYALIDSMSILQNTKAAIHKNHLYTWTFNNPLNRVDKNTLLNSVSLTATINGFFKSYAFSGDTAYLLSSGFNSKMRLHAINLSTMQIMHIDSALGNGREANVYLKDDSLLYFVYMNETNNNYEVKEYSILQQSVLSTNTYIQNRTTSGFFGKYTGANDAVYFIDHPSSNWNIQQFSFNTKQADTNFVSRSTSAFSVDALRFNRLNNNLFLAETGGVIKRFDTSGTSVGTNIQLAGFSTTYDIAFHKQSPPVTTASLNENKKQLPFVSVYPNPSFNGIININSSTNSNIQVTIYNLLGSEIISEAINGKHQFQLSPGVYVYRVLCENNIHTGKLIVK